MKRLAVFAGEQLVGYLQESQQYQLLFRYAPDWLTNPNAIALCANLPLTEQIFTGAQCRGEIKADGFKSCRTANA